MAVEHVYADVVVANSSCVSPENALGNTPTTWTGNTSNTSWNCRWGLTTPVSPLTVGATHHVYVTVRRDAAGGSNPTVSVDLYSAGVLVRNVYATATIGDTAVLDATFTTAEVVDPAQMEVLVTATGSGGKPADRRNVQVAMVDLAMETTPQSSTTYQAAGTVAVSSTSSGSPVIYGPPPATESLSITTLVVDATSVDTTSLLSTSFTPTAGSTLVATVHGGGGDETFYIEDLHGHVWTKHAELGTASTPTSTTAIFSAHADSGLANQLMVHRLSSGSIAVHLHEVLNVDTVSYEGEAVGNVSSLPFVTVLSNDSLEPGSAWLFATTVGSNTSTNSSGSVEVGDITTQGLSWRTTQSYWRHNTGQTSINTLFFQVYATGGYSAAAIRLHPITSSGTTYEAAGQVTSTTVVSGSATVVPSVTWQASGQVQATSTTSGSVTLIPGPVTWQAEASVQALTKSSGSVALKRPASGSTDIQSTSSGTSILRAASAGTSVSVTTVSGSAKLVPAPVWQASGTVQVLSGVQGDADRAKVRYQASGAVEVLSTVSGTTTSRGVVSGDVISSSSVSGSVTVRSFPTGSVSATTQITGSLTSRRYPTGTVPVVTTISDQAVARHYFAGTSEVVSTVSGAPIVKGAPVHPASGTISSSSSASGSVTSLLPSTGIFEVQTDAQGTATARHMPQGSVFVTTGTSGSPMAILTPTGVVPVLSQSQGEVTAWLYPSGQIEVLSSVSGSPVARTGAVYAASGEVSVLTGAQGTVYLKFLMHQQAMGTVNIKTWTVGEANEVMSVAAIVTAESLVSGAPVLKSPLQQEVVSVTSSVSGKAYIPTTQSWFIYENGVEVPLVFEGRMETGSLTPGELFPR